LSDVRVSSSVAEDLSVKITVTLSTSDPSVPSSGAVVIKNASGTIVKSAEVEISDGSGTVAFEAASGELELWWPVHYGKQALHTVEIQLAAAVSISPYHITIHSMLNIPFLGWENSRFQDGESWLPARQNCARAT